MMENKQKLFKGEFMEELLRNYFLNLGYYVVRGVKFRYYDYDVTDIDLYLYGRASTLTRERINVDIKNKKSPQVFERIIWTNGVMKLLGFNSCIVATTDEKPIIHSFGQLHDTAILDGAFLSKLKTLEMLDRINEEELLFELSKHKSFKTFDNRDWRHLYEKSKSRLLNEQDYSGFNSTLILLKYFIEKSLVDVQKTEIATRMIYIIMSHLLVIIDFILKDIAFLDADVRTKRISEGINYGNLGKEGVSKIIEIAHKISGRKVDFSADRNMLILVEYFSKLEVTKNLFTWAKEYEKLGYSGNLINPNVIENVSLKSPLFVLLDYFQIERRKFLIHFSENSFNSNKEDFNKLKIENKKIVNEKFKSEVKNVTQKKNENLNIEDDSEKNSEIKNNGNLRDRK